MDEEIVCKKELADLQIPIEKIVRNSGGIDAAVRTLRQNSQKAPKYTVLGIQEIVFLTIEAEGRVIEVEALYQNKTGDKNEP